MDSPSPPSPVPSLLLAPSCPTADPSKEQIADWANGAAISADVADLCWKHFERTEGVFCERGLIKYKILYINDKDRNREAFVAERQDLLERVARKRYQDTKYPFWPDPTEDKNYTGHALHRTGRVASISLPGYPPRVRCAYDAKDRLVVIKFISSDPEQKGDNEADILFNLGSVWSGAALEVSTGSTSSTHPGSTQSRSETGMTSDAQTVDRSPVSALAVDSSPGSPTLRLVDTTLESKVRAAPKSTGSGPSHSSKGKPRPPPIQRVTGNRVIPVLEVIAHDTWRFVVMPYWAGGPCRGPPFYSPEHYLLAAYQMIQGLVFLHNQRRVHLNISPSSIVMNHFSDRWTEAKLKSGEYLHFYDRKKFDCQYAYIGFTHSGIVSDDGMLRKIEFPRQCHRVPELATDADLHSDAVHDAFKVDVWMLGQVLKEQFEQNARFEEEMQILEEKRLTYILRHQTSESQESFGQSYLSRIELEMMDPDPSFRLTAAEALGEIEELQRTYLEDRARRAAVQPTTVTDLEASHTSTAVDLESDETGLDTQELR